MVGHVGDGNFHSLVLYDPKDKEKQKIIREYSDKLIEKALELEGTITGEHGIGFIQKVFPDGNVKSERGNVGNAQIIGLESLLDFDLNEIFIKNNDLDFNYFINYSFIESKYLRSEEVGITENSVEFIPKHNFKTGLKFGYKDLVFNIQYSYISEQFTDSSNERFPM